MKSHNTNRENIKHAVSYLEYLFPDYKFKFESTDSEIIFCGATPNIQNKIFKTLDPSFNKNEKLKDEIIRFPPFFNYKKYDSKLLIGADFDGKGIVINPIGSKSNNNLLVSGYTGGGKTVLLRTILNNLMLDKDTHPEIYIADPTRNLRLDYDRCKMIESAEPLSLTLRKIQNIMYDRLELLSELNTTISDDGSFDQGDYFVINDKLFNKYEDIKVSDENELNNNKFKIMKPEYITKYEDELHNYKIAVTEKKNHLIMAPIRVNKVNNDGRAVLNPIYVIIEEYEYYMESKYANKILSYLTKIAMLGRAANICLILSSQSFRGNSLPASLRNNFGNVIICGRTDNNNYRLLTNDGPFEFEFMSRKPGNAVLYNKQTSEETQFKVFYTSEFDLADSESRRRISKHKFDEDTYNFDLER